MRRHAFLIIFGLFFTLSLTMPAAAGAPAFKPGEVLVQFKPERRAAAVGRSQRDLGVRVVRTSARSQVVQLALPETMSVSQALAIYGKDPDVLFVEPNYLLYAQDMPNDPNFDQQWGLSNTGQRVSGAAGLAGADIDAAGAWELAAGGDQVLVAVVDTGCHLTHPDLIANLWSNGQEVPDNGLDDDQNGYVDDYTGWDFADNDNYPQDVSGHGTHVAGIIAATRDNGRGIAGVAPQARIMPLRFMNGFDTGTVSDAVAAIEYALNKGARIINCSWGSSGYSSALYNVMAGANALFICAAGNNSNDSDRSGFYPAGYDLENVISVAASDQMDQLAWFSNYGLHSVHLAAPGSNIYSLGIAWQDLLAEGFSAALPSGWVTGGVPDSWGVRLAPDNGLNSVLALTAEAAYANDADNWVMLPVLDLSAASACQLTFQVLGATDALRDYLFAEVSADAETWVNLPLKVGDAIKYGGLSGTYSYWTQVMADLGAWDHHSRLYLRFHFVSNGSVTDVGYFLDHVIVSAASDDEAYVYMSGTSMAAPFVSGVAALVQAAHPELTPVAVKKAILDAVDVVDTLSGTSESAGRLNARKALNIESGNAHADLSSSSGGGGGGGGGCFISLTIE